jgi:hypothetical protein
VSRAVILVAVLITAASAPALGRLWFTDSTIIAAGQVASMDGVTVQVNRTEWAPMDHLEDTSGGFAQPAQMMPGAPGEDEVRLGVKVTLMNTQSRTHEFSLPEEFTMTGGLESEPLGLSADTVGPIGRLGPGFALNAVLYFDVRVPEAGGEMPPLYLNWTRGGDAIQIQVPLPGGEAPAHDH